MFDRLPIFLLLFISMIQYDTYASEQLLNEILEASNQREANSAVFQRALAGNRQQEQRQALLP